MWGITSKITRLTFDPLFGTVGLRREFFESSPFISVSHARHRRRRDGWGPGNDTRGALAIERGLTWSFFRTTDHADQVGLGEAGKSATFVGEQSTALGRALTLPW